MKRVLILTYYWPPSGGPGVQRWVKFVKYLKNYGWEPVVYAPKDADYPLFDHSFDKEIPGDVTVLRNPIWEPYTVYRKFTGRKPGSSFNAGGFISDDKTKTWKEQLALWIRSNFFIPDARKFWIRPTVRFLSRYLKEEPVDLIVSTGPPHSLHLAALKLKNNTSLPWIADFRDPWTKIYFYPDLLLTKAADNKHHRLEKRVLQQADCIVTVGKKIASEFREMGAKKVEVITNGYDHKDFEDVIPITSDHFRLVHTGNINTTKNQKKLWKAIAELKNEHPGFAESLKIVQAGKADVSVYADIEEYQLSDNFDYLGYLNHNEIVRLQAGASVLLLLISDTPHAKGVLTGKLFEYLAAGKPVLAIAPLDSDLAEIINSSHAGVVVDFNDKTGMKKALEHFYLQYKKGILAIASEGAEQYTRMNLTKKMAAVMDDIVAEQRADK